MKEGDWVDERGRGGDDGKSCQINYGGWGWG